MQSICLNISLLSDIDDGNELDTTLIEKSYKSITINLPYEEVANKLKAGPSTRGQKRKTYKINEKEEFDVYGMIIKAITLNPPIISVTIDELKNRIDKLMKDVEFKIDKSKVRDTLKKIQEIIDSSGPLYQVFEWKDNQIYIIEPLFLFYIRWGVH